MITLLRALLLLSAAFVAAFFLACGDDDGATPTPTPTPTSARSPAAESPTSSPARTSSPTASPSATADTTVRVTLSEYEIELSADSGPPGTYTFALENVGPDETHQFMVVDTALEPDALPTTDTGAFDPSGGDATILANSPGLGPESNDTFRVELAAGSYVFICNLADAEGRGHYGLGMRTAFTVE
jgi:hypothetical protein